MKSKCAINFQMCKMKFKGNDGSDMSGVGNSWSLALAGPLLLNICHLGLENK